MILPLEILVGSSDMPLLTPEVPSLGGPTAASPNPDLRIEAPPVLKLFGEGDTCDQARNKSEGNPASMNSDSSNGIGAASSTNARELDQLNADNEEIINLQEVQQRGKILNTGYCFFFFIITSKKKFLDATLLHLQFSRL